MKQWRAGMSEKESLSPKHSRSITFCPGATNYLFTTMNWSQDLLQQLHVPLWQICSPVPESDLSRDTSSRHDGAQMFDSRFKKRPVISIRNCVGRVPWAWLVIKGANKGVDMLHSLLWYQLCSGLILFSWILLFTKWNRPCLSQRITPWFSQGYPFRTKPSQGVIVNSGGVSLNTNISIHAHNLKCWFYKRGQCSVHAYAN